MTVINLVKNSSVWEKEGGGQGPQPVEGLRKRLFNLQHQKNRIKPSSESDEELPALSEREKG